MAAIDDQDLSRALWRKSSFSGNGNECVEVGTASDVVGVRDTKDRSAGTLRFTPDVWRAFLSNVRNR